MVTHVDPEPSDRSPPPFNSATGGPVPVRALSLFGSLARQEQAPSSDVDLLVDFAEGATLFDLVGLGLFLEEKLGCPVDVVPRRALRREIRDEALKKAVPV